MMAKTKNIVETKTEDIDMKKPVHTPATHEEVMAMIERIKRFESLSLEDLYKKSIEAEAMTKAIDEAIEKKRVQEVKKLAANIAEQVSAADISMKEIIEELLVYVPPESKLRIVRQVKGEAKVKGESKARHKRPLKMDNSDAVPVKGTTYKLESGEPWTFTGKARIPKQFEAALRAGKLWKDLVV
jgi:proline dehydrogenase